MDPYNTVDTDATAGPSDTACPTNEYDAHRALRDTPRATRHMTTNDYYELVVLQLRRRQ